MKRKVYKTPAMKVVKLQHQSLLITQSEGIQSMRNGYGTANEDTWDE